MPGLIDSHAHLSWANAQPLADFAQLIAAGKASFKDWPHYGQQASLAEAENRLMSGYTSVREVGGVSHMVKGCIDTSLNDKGVAILGKPGPRVWQSGAVISATGGHADAETDFEEKFRFIKNLDQMTVQERENLVMQFDAFGLRKADGVMDVKKAVRDQFVKGANFIKLATGGGSSSPHDPIDATTYSADEVRAAVEVTDGLNTYATTHAYESFTIERDLKNGVQMIEHANLIDDRTAKILKSKEKLKNEKGFDTSVWVDLSPFFDNQFANPKEGIHFLKQKVVQKGTICSYGYVKKYQLNNVGLALDIMFENGGAIKAPMMLAHMPKDLEPLQRPGVGHQCKGVKRPYFYSNFDILKMAIYNNARILTKSGPRTPYAGMDGAYLKPESIGVIAPGAVADLILVDGNPLVSLDMFYDVKKNIRMIMKDGVIYKNTIQ
jgi:imidazolonepropionase-like amidohydrolase